MAELTRRDFRAAILYDYKRGLSVDESCRSLKNCFGELRAPSRTTVFNRFREFKAGQIYLDKSDEQSAYNGANMEAKLVCEYVEKVRELIRVDPTISQLEIAKKLALDLGIVRTIVNQALRLGQLNLQWTPATLTDQQRSLRQDWASFMLDKFDNGTGSNIKRIVACYDTWIYKCRTVKKSSRVTTEYWTFESCSKVIEKRMVICFFSVSGISVVASLNNLRTLKSRELIESCLVDVINDWRVDCQVNEKTYLCIEALSCGSTRLLNFLHEKETVLIGLPECSPDLTLGGSFLEPAFWTSMQRQRFPTQEDAVIEYKNCLNNAVPDMWNQLFVGWFKRMRKCVDVKGDYVEPINFNLDLSGGDAASVMVNPNSVMPSHMSLRLPTTINNPSTSTAAQPSSTSAASSSNSTTTTAATTNLTAATTINGVKRHFNFTPKIEPKEENPDLAKFLLQDSHELEEGEAESDNDRDYENDGSDSEEDEDEESEEEEPTLQATAQPHGLKLTIPSNGLHKSKTLLLPASSIKTISPQLIKASQHAGQQALKVNGFTGIRVQNLKILGQNGNVQQLRRQIYSNGVQAHIVTQTPAQQQQHQQLLQQQLAAAAAAASSSPNAARKTVVEKDLVESLGHDYDDKAYPKPAYSYSCLIAMALKNSQTGSLPVSEIYNFMCEHFPYFKTAPNGWKNSVRHNLSLNKCFEKIEKPAGNGNQRKGCLWAINPAKVAKMDEEVQKWSRKDPLAIKKAMIYPDHLELLERGEMKFVGSGSNGDMSEETESSSDEVECPEETVHSHQLAANSVTDSYDESSQDCDVDVSEQLYDEIDIDENKDALHMQLNISKQDDYQLSPSAKRQKTIGSTLQANYVYQAVPTARRKTPITFLASAPANSFLKLESSNFSS